MVCACCVAAVAAVAVDLVAVLLLAVVMGRWSWWQVGAQQAIGPARCQIVYATGPLWAALLAFALLAEVTALSRGQRGSTP
jgi:drug/metabolite transporter (DMT)-like permease